MKWITFNKPVVQNGRLIKENYLELINLIKEYNGIDNTWLGLIPEDFKLIEYDLENGIHIIMLDFLDGQGIMLDQNGNDYRFSS